MTSQYKTHSLITAALLVLTIGTSAYAAPRTNPFTIGATIDPGAEFVQPCGPTDANCFVAVLGVEDEGTTLTLNAVKLNFVGTGVTATTNASGTVTITIPGGSGTTTQSLTFSTSTGNILSSTINGVSTTTTISELRNLLLSGTTTASTIVTTNLFAQLVQSVTGMFTNLFAAVGNFGNVLTGNITATGTAQFATTSVSALTAVTSTFSGNMMFSGTAANIVLGSNYLSGDGDDEGISVSASGEVSIGTLIPFGGRLSVAIDDTNASSTAVVNTAVRGSSLASNRRIEGGRFQINSNSTINGAYTSVGLRADTNTSVSTGITNSAGEFGFQSTFARGLNTSGGDGTLAIGANAQLTYGHFSAFGGSPITTNMYGLRLSPQHRTGTITNWYDLHIENDAVGGATVANQWSLYNNSTKRSYFAGTLGLGDTSPENILDIHSDSAAASLAISSLGTDTDPSIKFELSDNTPLFTLGIDDSDDDKFKISGAALGTNDRFVIDTSGNVGIGTTTPSAQLSTTGTVRFSNFGAGTLTTDALGNLSVSSDESLKDISGAFTSGLDSLLNINPIAYKWNTASGLETAGTYYGFSAQNVQATLPEAVGVDSRGKLTLSDRPLLAASINAIKEQQKLLGQYKLSTSTQNSLITDIQNETVRSPIAVITDKINNSKSFLQDFVAARVTAIRGYFDQIFTKKLCLVKDNGQEVCLDANDLEAIKAGNSVPSTTSGVTGGTTGTSAREETVADGTTTNANNISVVDVNTGSNAGQTTTTTLSEQETTTVTE
jgi:Chaperone of endosialidase